MHTKKPPKKPTLQIIAIERQDACLGTSGDRNDHQSCFQTLLSLWLGLERSYTEVTQQAGLSLVFADISQEGLAKTGQMWVEVWTSEQGSRWELRAKSQSQGGSRTLKTHQEASGDRSTNSHWPQVLVLAAYELVRETSRIYLALRVQSISKFS